MCPVNALGALRIDDLAIVAAGVATEPMPPEVGAFLAFMGVMIAAIFLATARGARL